MSDEFPERIRARIQQYRVRAVLWSEYGLSWPDWTFEEICEVLELHSADQDHMINVARKTRK